MKKFLTILLALGVCMSFAGVALAQTPDGETPAEETVCDDESGAAFGLCNAYCEAMDCESDDPQASANACTRVGDKFEQITGRIPPCEISCPCFTAEDLQEGGAIAECGVNFPGFSNLAGVRYTNGGIACSGELCATGAPGVLSCAISTPADFVIVNPITEDDDFGCRTLILQNCPNPNLDGGSAAAESSTAFIDG